MKKLFPGYFKPTNEEFKVIWSKAIFVVDANILLNLYRYSDSLRTQWLTILKNQRKRFWLPYQAAHEFHQNRMSVISTEQKKYTSLIDELTQLSTQINQKLNQTFRMAPDQTEGWKKNIEKELFSVRTQVEKFQKEHPNFFENDNILEELNSIFSDNIGNPHSEDFKRAVEKEGEARYAKKVPPGYEDKTKRNENSFGDLLIWKEIIQQSKISKKPIIMITDDAKEDWWQINDGKTTGPNPKLIQEFAQETGEMFYAYNSTKFLEHYSSQLGTKISENTVNESKAIASDYSEMLLLGNRLIDNTFYQWSRSNSKLLQHNPWNLDVIAGATDAFNELSNEEISLLRLLLSKQFSSKKPDDK